MDSRFRRNLYKKALLIIKKDVLDLQERLTINPGGAEGGRTPDLLNAIQTRSQLRHSPLCLSRITY